MKTRKFAIMLGAAALSLTLVGGGLAATFTDSAVVTDSVSVGQFGIALLNPSTGCTLVDAHHITCGPSSILSSAAGNSPISFDVKNVQTIPAAITVVATVSAGAPAEFTAMPVLPATSPTPVVLAAGATQTFSAGIQWTVLGNGDLNQTVTVTYTINASA